MFENTAADMLGSWLILDGAIGSIPASLAAGRDERLVVLLVGDQRSSRCLGAYVLLFALPAYLDKVVRNSDNSFDKDIMWENTALDTLGSWLVLDGAIGQHSR